MFRITFRRFAELLGLCIVLSAITTAFYELEIIKTQNALVFWSFLFVAIFIFINVKMMRNCYFDLVGTHGYYIGNYAAYLIFAGVNFIIYKLNDMIYTWLFAITKFAKYLGPELSTTDSALAFHIIMLTIVAVAPVGMKQMYAWWFN